METSSVTTVENKQFHIPIVEIEPVSKPRFLVVGTTFIAQTSDGELRIPVRIKTKHIRTIKMGASVDEIDQLNDLLALLGDTATVERLDELDFFETLEIATAFFQAWQDRNEVSLGESQRSSR